MGKFLALSICFHISPSILASVLITPVLMLASGLITPVLMHASGLITPVFYFDRFKIESDVFKSQFHLIMFQFLY